MVDVRYSFGFICPEDSISIEAVQLRPTPEQQVVIDAYRAKYREAMQRAPHGLHYLPFPGEPETVAVWLPIDETPR